MIEREEACNIAQAMLQFSGLKKLKTKIKYYDSSQNAWRVKVYRFTTGLEAGTILVSCQTGCILDISSRLVQFAKNRKHELKIPPIE